MAKNIIPTFLLGTAVKITSMINIAEATTAKITIDDPSSTEKVTDAAMTKDADGIYSYIFQTVSTWTDGTYIATISYTCAGYTAVIQDYFEMTEQE